MIDGTWCKGNCGALMRIERGHSGTKVIVLNERGYELSEMIISRKVRQQAREAIHMHHNCLTAV